MRNNTRDGRERTRTETIKAHLWRALEELGGSAEAVRRTSSVAARPPLCKLLLEIIGGRVFDCEDGAGDMVYEAT